MITALEQAEIDGMAGATVKSLARTKKAVENKLKQLEEKALVKDDVIHFEELGVDQLFIDEAHLFKNLFIYTKTGCSIRNIPFTISKIMTCNVRSS